ncbi:discoidin domain-containing protein [Streptomyces avicenniae]|uniref:discoidin domain-containing protein n=1 Tax=Streptomyces avicenniae TaxID=500153 RepID=UPI000ADE02A8|nr:discoidin domain-containing protein [Streptomyces avicenniae]
MHSPPTPTTGPPRARAVTILLLLLSLVMVPALPAAHAAQPPVGQLMYPQGLGADLGPEPETLGIDASAGQDPAGLRTGELDGRGFWGTDVAAGTGELTFAFDQDWLTDLPGDSILGASVTYRDAGEGDLLLTAGGTVQRIALTGSDTWRTTAIEAPADGADGLVLSGEQDGQAADVTVAALRVSAVGASADLGASLDTRALSVRAGDNPDALITGEHEGRGYWRTDQAGGTGFVYASVDDTYAYDHTGPVLVSIDYLDEGTGGFLLHYDSPGEELIDRFWPTPVVQLTGSGEWRTHTFALDDAILTNRANGADFRFAAEGGDVSVGAIRVTALAAALEPAAGLDRLIGTAERIHDAAREGERDGQFPAGAKAQLAAAIEAAAEIAGQDDLTGDQAKEALAALREELVTFEARAVNTNLAVGATATASSGDRAAAAVDGDAGTSWVSGTAGDGEWLTVDLGRRQRINDVRVTFGARLSTEFEVQVSTDGRRFKDVRLAGGTEPNREVRLRFDTEQARYVRISLTGYMEAANTQTISEVEVRKERTVTPRPRLVDTRFSSEGNIVADFDAVRYGADPSGRRDSTAAIQQAILDCYDAGGGTVWLPAGTYRVTDTVEVFAFCTLRGDRRDPDTRGRDYGTVITADVPAGEDGPVLFRVGGSAGVSGLTTWYPEQDAEDPVPYNYTFQIPGRAWASDENYMMSTVTDVTMLNSYRGIGLSTMANDRGQAPSNGQVHESATVRNIRGTVLFDGATAYNGADVGTWENIVLDNSYWADAPAAYDPPARATLDAWTREHGTGLTLGDLEWDQFHRVRVSDYRTGIHVVPGQRAEFTGSFLETEVRRTDTALLVDGIDNRWGMQLADSVLEGSVAAVDNNAAGYVKLTDVELTGAVEGTVHQLTGELPERYEPAPTPQARRATLYDVDAPHGVGVLPERDATRAIQRALDRAGRAGGGIVYLRAGWYRVDGHLDVPRGVELRGASAGPNRDLLGSSGGTVLMAREGRGTEDAATATAFITLSGNGAGVTGLRVFYPENSAAPAEGVAAYPYAIRGDADGVYVVNVGLPNAWSGVDMGDSDDFLVRKLAGAYFNGGIRVGASEDGRIEGVLSNGNATARVGYALAGWGLESSIFPQVIDRYTRAQSDLVTVDGASGLRTLNVFGYGYRNGLVVTAGEATAYQLGTDNLNADGVVVSAADGTDVTAVNLARYNGATSSGPVNLVNVMAINMVSDPVAAAAEPAEAGTVTLGGHQVEPGRYERGSTVTARAEAAEGYRFDHWTADGEPLDGGASLTLTVEGPLDLTAHFTATD